MAIVLTDVMGIFANIMSNVAYLPQIVRSYRRKQVDDLSMGMFVILFVTNICWVGYALPIQAKHLWTSALIEIGLLLPIFGLWFRYRSVKPKSCKRYMHQLKFFLLGKKTFAERENRRVERF